MSRRPHDPDEGVDLLEGGRVDVVDGAGGVGAEDPVANPPGAQAPGGRQHEPVVQQRPGAVQRILVLYVVVGYVYESLIIRLGPYY